MMDSCAQRGATGIGGRPGPLRPCHKAVKEHKRLHPYRRVARCANAVNGNGHTHTLPTGVNGVVQDSNAVVQPIVQELLGQIAAGSIDLQTADKRVQELGNSPQKEEREGSWGIAGVTEDVIWAPGKTAAQVAIALQRLAQEAGTAMAAQVAPEVAVEVLALLPDAKYSSNAKAITVSAPGKKQQKLPGTVAIITDGPAGDPVVEETRLASTALGCYSYQLGGSSKGEGLSSLFPNLSAVQSAAVVIVIAREMVTLPAIIAGAVQTPVVAVPSISSGQAVVNAPGVSVVPGDNGVAAAIFAARILKSASRLRGPPSPA